MNHKWVTLMGMVAISLLGLACGGGGGGSSAGGGAVVATATQSGGFYSVRYKESTVNSPVITANYETTVTVTSLSGQLSPSKDLIVGAESTGTGLPEFLIALQGGATTAPSANFQAVVYGKGSGASDSVAVGQVMLDFSGATPTATAIGVTNANFTGQLQTLLPASTTFTTDATNGRVTWGSWSGMLSSDSSTLLLSFGNVFLLASKESTHTYSELTSASSTVAMIFQFDDPSQHAGSAAGSTTFTSAAIPTAGPNAMNPSFSQNNLSTTGTSNFPTSGATRDYFLAGTGNTLIQLYATGTTAGVTEQGFIGFKDFYVVMNPDNPVRPNVSIGFLAP